MIDKKSYLLGAATAGGGGSDIEIIDAKFTENGVYNANDNAIYKIRVAYNYEEVNTRFDPIFDEEGMEIGQDEITEYIPMVGNFDFETTINPDTYAQIIETIPECRDAIAQDPTASMYWDSRTDDSYMILETIAAGKQKAYGTVTVDVPTVQYADLPDEAYELPSSCNYMFQTGNFNWFLKNYWHKVVMKDKINGVQSAINMFSNQWDGRAERGYILPNSKEPIEIHNDCYYIFGANSSLRQLPTNFYFKDISSCGYAFINTYNLREIPDNIFQYWRYNGGQYVASCDIFNGCCSLRTVPSGFFDGWVSMAWEEMDYSTEPPQVIRDYSYGSLYYNLFAACYALDEIEAMPVMGIYEENAFNEMLNACSRLKRFTFIPNQTAKWVNQLLHLGDRVGYTPHQSYISGYNSGITADKEVKDAATYEALKNDPDWYTTNVAYSRYNHDSAVETINSLPDCSAYCAEMGGTNTISLNGASGSATDGGAINTMTADEIAVAAAKGWTVSFV